MAGGPREAVDRYQGGITRAEEVVFLSGDATLRGTLNVPDTSGRQPAVVLLQEAGPRKRHFGFWPISWQIMALATPVPSPRLAVQPHRTPWPGCRRTGQHHNRQWRNRLNTQLPDYDWVIYEVPPEPSVKPHKGFTAE